MGNLALLGFRRNLLQIRLGIFLDDMDVHLLKQWCVGVGQPGLDFVGIVDVDIGLHGREVPQIVLFEIDPFAADHRMAGPLDAKIHLGRVVPDRPGLFAGIEHLDNWPDTGRQTEPDAQLVGVRMNDPGLPSPVIGHWNFRQPLDLAFEIRTLDYGGLP